MEGLTPHEQYLREHLHPDAARITDAQHILEAARATGLPFPSLSRDRAVFFFVAIADAKTARAERAQAECSLQYALRVPFAPRRTRAGSTEHHILTAVLPSGMKVDLVALAEHIDGVDAPARELAEVAA
jgi:hypothetical protein